MLYPVELGVRFESTGANSRGQIGKRASRIALKGEVSHPAEA
jgi:hypothetical protein